MLSYLQTKSVSLALEAKYIRHQELRFAKKARLAHLFGKDRSALWHEKNREGQYQHRVTIVRNEARITNIARGFLSGLEYGQVERKARTEPDWYRVQNLILTYAERSNPKFNQTVEEKLAEWYTRAIVYFNEHRIIDVPRKKKKQLAA